MSPTPMSPAPMFPVQHQLMAAREAFARGDWDAARRAMERAANEAALGVEDQEILARSKWWLGDVQGSMALSEDIFHSRVADGHAQSAARAALMLSLQWGLRGNIAVSSAWLNRARLLLESLPESVEHGYLLYLEGNDAIYLEGDAGPALSASVQLKELSRRLVAPELASFASMLSGLAAVRSGDASNGFRDLDEAMLPVLAGQVPAEWGGDIYCSVIHLCYEMADYSRMRAWTDALATWCAGLSTSFMYAGIVRVHELQLLSAEGNWAQVESEIAELGERLRNAHGWIAADCFCELGEIRRRRGDTAGAAAAFASARELGVDAQPGPALLLAQAGRTEAATDALRAALAERGPLGRAWLLLPMVELLAPGNPAAAEIYCRELELTASRYGSPGFLGRAHHARGSVLMAERRWPEAMTALEAAAQAYRSQRLRYELAEIHDRLASVNAAMGEHRAADAERATAAAIRAQLGAANISWLKTSGEPGGLTSREVEVLSCVLSGSSNRQIADSLTISEKTAGRHLANIFTKIGVTSRTAAAAWARQHGIPERPKL
ncbi:DNA-binding NarL/FixJ family response regulator [Pseudarthrobacter sp. PvP004]|uniref:helix-turn-helix domain-containing protein n=1 Tax=Pseudarthrobacter sp. PvP004 TaxID=2817850 RepID=UPI001AEA8D4B|nr:helix-turn-helix transcriptional regulator [Pseudarthrobacter sp. PvP004]MBP2266570.1 DNA-binding NarL/FixJ family response regulator [Pseudarthrobacter sp. PvP004]